MGCPSVLELQGFVDRELDAPRQSAVGAHLIHCPKCQGKARDLSSTAALLRILAEVPAGPGFVVPAPAPGRRVPGWRWALLPAAAAGLMALAVTVWRPWTAPAAEDTFLKVFVEAHQTSVPDDGLPKPCDFGLAGDWP